MNFAIRYLTTYTYDTDVADNLNALRVKPAANGRQRCDEFSVRLDPEVRLHRHNDYFGTEVVEFEVSRPHRKLTIDVRARVSTKSQPEPPRAPWEALREPAYIEAGGEFLLQSDDAPTHPVMKELLAATRAASTPLDALLLVCELIPDRFEYRQDATYVDSTVKDLLDVGGGVCQDFVHLGVCILRHHGIAARYVSGIPVRDGRDRRRGVRRGRHARVAGGAAADARRVRARVGGRRPDQPRTRRRNPREDRPRPPLRRRAADQGRLPRRRRGRARGERDDDPARARRPGLDRAGLRPARRQLAESPASERSTATGGAR